MKESEDSKTFWQRYQPIIAAALGLMALFFLGRMLFSSTSKKPVQEKTSRSTNQRVRDRDNVPDVVTTESPLDAAGDNPIEFPRPILVDFAPPPVVETTRNIFAYTFPLLLQ